MKRKATAPKRSKASDQAESKAIREPEHKVVRGAEPVENLMPAPLNLDAHLRAMEDEAKNDRKAFYDADKRPNGNDRAMRMRTELTDALTRVNNLIIGM